MVSDRMLISILSVSVESLDMSCTEAPFVLAPRAWEFNPEDLLSPFLLICVFKKLNLF